MKRRKSLNYVRLRFWDDGRRDCYYCGHRLHMGGRDRYSMTVDHLIPLSKGGYNKMSNFVPSCGPCNVAKGDMGETEFRRAVSRGIIDPLKIGNKNKNKAKVFAEAMAQAKAKRIALIPNLTP